MPNWCTNDLTILNEPKPFDKVMKKYIKKRNRETFLDFEKIIPFSPCIKESLSIDYFPKKQTLEEYEALKKAQENKCLDECGFKSWYDWSVANWGTKWNSCDCDFNEYGVSFNTAWSPPIPVIKALAKLTERDLRLIYIEEGCDFCGELLAYNDGQFKDNYYNSVKDAPQSLLDELGYQEWVDEEEN